MVTITLHERNSLIITYSDNGKGFDSDKVLNKLQSGMGYDNMYTRLMSISGQMTLKTNPGEGVWVTIEAPVK